MECGAIFCSSTSRLARNQPIEVISILLKMTPCVLTSLPCSPCFDLEIHSSMREIPRKCSNCFFRRYICGGIDWWNSVDVALQVRTRSRTITDILERAGSIRELVASPRPGQPFMGFPGGCHVKAR
jgi:hypothetical protein